MGRCFFEDDCNEPEEQRLGVGSRHSMVQTVLKRLL